MSSGNERLVLVVRGIWGLITVIVRLMWSALTWSLSRDRWQISAGLTFLGLATMLIGVPIYLYIRTLGVLARWQMVSLLMGVGTLMAVGISFLYSYSVDRSKVVWLETREREANREMNRAKITFREATKVAVAGAMQKLVDMQMRPAPFEDASRPRKALMPAPNIRVIDEGGMEGTPKPLTQDMQVRMEDIDQTQD
jgi:hypothetical protein